MACFISLTQASSGLRLIHGLYPFSSHCLESFQVSLHWKERICIARFYVLPVLWDIACSLVADWSIFRIPVLFWNPSKCVYIQIIHPACFAHILSQPRSCTTRAHVFKRGSSAILHQECPMHPLAFIPLLPQKLSSQSHRRFL